ncbi:putative reverse transcriptase domain-containing protein [Tanacetum coccineum]
MAPRGRPTRTTRSRPVTATPPPVTTTPPPVADPTTTTSVTSAQLQAMIDEGVNAVLAARAATRNGDDSHTSGTGARRNERTVRECTYQDFMKCQPIFFRGTEEVVNLTQWFERMETVFRISNCTVENQVKFATCTLLGTALTWWNSHARTVTNDVAYAMTWPLQEQLPPVEEQESGKCLIDDIWIYQEKPKKEHEEHLKNNLELLTIRGVKLYSAPILALPEGSEDFIVYCDASKKGLGVVLMQWEKGKANVVADALSRKEREPPLRVRALNNSSSEDVGGRLIENAKYPEAIRTETSWKPRNGGTYAQCRSWLPCYAICGCVMLEFHKLTVFYPSRFRENVPSAAPLRIYGRQCRSPFVWAEVGEVLTHRSRLVQETTEKIFKLNKGCKVSPWKGVVRFGKRGKLNPRFVGPFKVIKRVGDVAYKLELPEELSRVHNTFHVSNLKKCHADEPLAVPLDGLHFDDKLQFVEEPDRDQDRESNTVNAKDHIISQGCDGTLKRGPEFT